MIAVVLSLVTLGFLGPVIGTAATSNVTIGDGDLNRTVSWCVGDNCSRNVKDHYEHVENASSTVDPKPQSTEPPFWCPEGYLLAGGVGKWLQVCRPMPCSAVYRLGDGEEAVTIPCPKAFTPGFLQCPGYDTLPEGQYEMMANGSLKVHRSGEMLPLGEFWIRGESAVVCDPKGTLESRPQRCVPVHLTRNAIFHLRSNGSLDTGPIGKMIPPGYFRENGSSVDFCVKVDPSLETCPYDILSGKHIELRENLDLFTNDEVEVVYPLGHYVLDVMHRFAIVCITTHPTAETRTETRYLYGTAAVVSGVSLLLALVAHIFFPSLNYHTKALLCLAFSFLVMYIALAIRLFAGTFRTSPTANLIVFAIQYTFALSAFFWLSVIGYDLWRVFSKLKGSVNPGNSAGKKRVFFAKCVYAFGIPALMCKIVLCIASSQSAQAQLNISLPLQRINWFIDTKTRFIFFYGPMLIILLENMAFFIATVVNIRRASSGTTMVNKKISRKLLKVYVKLFLVMGITWFAEVISGMIDSSTNEATWYVTDLLNCLQGLFIFLIYVCKRRTLIIIKNKMGYLSDSQAAQATSSTMDSERKVSAVALPNIQKSETSSSNSYTVM